MEDKKNGYIYIYKCMVGPKSDVCKVGKTDNYKERLRDHVRRPYHGFVPYCEFTTGKAIATVYKIKNIKNADKLINEIIGDKQFGDYEIYNLDYDMLIKKIYNGLKNKNELLEVIRDGYSLYDFIIEEEKVTNDTIKKNFEKIKVDIISKYDVLPEELLLMLRDKDDFINNCKSHYNTGNYIDFPNNMILDLNYNKPTRQEILDKLKKFV